MTTHSVPVPEQRDATEDDEYTPSVIVMGLNRDGSLELVEA